MRGIVLAGGRGCRLDPLTKTINKHLLPVWDRHMIMWPIQTLRDNGIDDITIVSSPEGIGQIAPALGGGYTYRVQQEPGGIPQAMMCARDHRSVEDVAVILGDNLFLPNPTICVGAFANCWLNRSATHDLTQFGVAKIGSAGYVSEVVEKPAEPPSKYAVTGLYVFSARVFGRISTLQASKRGELEIADLLNLYARDKMLSYIVHLGLWMDAGTHDGLLECSRAARRSIKEKE